MFLIISGHSIDLLLAFTLRPIELLVVEVLHLVYCFLVVLLSNAHLALAFFLHSSYFLVFVVPQLIKLSLMPLELSVEPQVRLRFLQVELFLLQAIELCLQALAISFLLEGDAVLAWLEWLANANGRLFSKL